MRTICARCRLRGGVVQRDVDDDGIVVRRAVGVGCVISRSLRGRFVIGHGLQDHRFVRVDVPEPHGLHARGERRRGKRMVEIAGFINSRNQIIGALGVDAPAYRDALAILASGRWPFADLPRETASLDTVDALLETMAGERDVPPVHAVLVP